MKKNLLLFSISVIAAFTANAQITVTQSDMPSAGVVGIQANDTLPIVTAGSAGANQTWNFSALKNQSQDTNSFISASGSPGASAFSSSNLAQLQSNGQYLYITSTSAAVTFDGVWGNFGSGPMALKFTPPEKFITFPSTYQTSFNGTTGYALQYAYPLPPSDSGKQRFDVTYSSVMDAYGSVTTPVGTYNCLRQMQIQTTIDSSFLHNSSTGAWTLNGTPTTKTDTSYTFWANNQKFPVVQFRKGNNNTQKVSYLLSATVGVNEKESSKNEINVYPNPASSQLNITGISGASYLMISDVEGRLMETTLLKKNISSINVSNYQNGIYFYQLVDMSGNTLSKGKFAVSK